MNDNSSSLWPQVTQEEQLIDQKEKFWPEKKIKIKDKQINYKPLKHCHGQTKLDFLGYDPQS